MLSPHQATLIPRIYDAAASESAWTSALDAVAQGSDAKGSALFALDTTGLPFAISQFSSIYTAEDAQYFLEHFTQYEAEGWDSLRVAPSRTYVLDQDVWPNVEDLVSRPDYVWLLEKVGTNRRGAARLNDTPGWIDSVALQYPAGLERVPRGVIEQAQAMLPHLAKTVELHRSFALLRSRYQAVLSALDRVKIGVCVTAPNGDVIVSNKEASRIFDLGDGLTLGRDARFRCTDGLTSAALDVAIGAAILTVKGDGDTHESLMAVPRRSGAHPFLVEVAPLADSAGELERDLRGAIVFLVDPENPRPFAIENAAKCFHLSQAEALVCALMVCGLTDAEIAAQRSVSVDTIKTQAKSIYRKTNTNRRADLIRLVLSITPPIETP
jgi:DNA-binding CsgD family transcriptional regulator